MSAVQFIRMLSKPLIGLQFATRPGYQFVLHLAGENEQISGTSIPKGVL